jgi:hypothetical protein
MSGTLLDKWKLLDAITYDPRASRADIVVAMVLLDHVDAKRGYSWISRPAIAAKKGLSPRHVVRSLDRLVSWGYFVETASNGRGNSQTFTPNYEAIEKVTRLSPITVRKKVTPLSKKGDTAVRKKVTPLSKKGDTAVRKKVTPLSKKGDTAVTPILLRNPLSETADESDSVERDPHAREADDDGFEKRVADEADDRAAFHARDRAWKEGQKSRPKAMKASSPEPGVQNTQAAAEPAPKVRNPAPPAPRAAAAGGFTVVELVFGEPIGQRGPFATAAEAWAERARIMRGQLENSVSRRFEVRGPDGNPLPIEDHQKSAAAG